MAVREQTPDQRLREPTLVGDANVFKCKGKTSQTARYDGQQSENVWQFVAQDGHSNVKQKEKIGALQV